jgi:PAP2 superfamily
VTLQRSAPERPAAFHPSLSSAAREPDADACWVCVACRQANPMHLDVCGGCSTSFAALLSADSRPSAVAATRTALLVAREAGLVVGLFVLWRIVSNISLLHESGAFARGRWIWRFERSLHLPSEASIQSSVLAHPVAVQALNIFYLVAHLGGMAALLLWLFIWHRDRYASWRNVVVAFTGVSLLIQFISIAPPRLLPQVGLVDTAARFHQSAYAGLGPGLADQLSAMPSIHVGWAVIAAGAVIAAARSRWRWLILAHPLVTVYVVIATANHFWLDAIAAIGLVGAVVVGQRAASRWWAGRRSAVGRAA